MKKHIICLSQEQRQSVEHLLRSGRVAARSLLHANVLLKIDGSDGGPNWSNQQVKEAFGAVDSTIWRIRTRFLAEGLPAALERRPQPERPDRRKLQGKQEAHLIALACQHSPEGRKRWTLRLLSDTLVALEIVESISHETVRKTLKKTNSNPGKSSNGASHPRRMPPSSLPWKMCSRCMSGPTMLGFRRSVWMR